MTDQINHRNRANAYLQAGFSEQRAMVEVLMWIAESLETIAELLAHPGHDETT